MKKAIGKVKEVKKNGEAKIDEVDAKNHHGNSIRCKCCDTIRKSFSVGHRILVDWVDSFSALLLLFSLYILFDYLLPMSTFFLGSISPVYVYSWLILWATIAVLLANREVKRRSKTVTSPKWFHNPNAINEYLELMKKPSSEN